MQKHNVTKNKKRIEKITSKQASHAGLTPFDEILHIQGLHLNIVAAAKRPTDFHVEALNAKARQKPQDSPGVEEMTRSAATILIVDDKELLRKMIGRFLHVLGYNVIVANSGETAI